MILPWISDSTREQTSKLNLKLKKSAAETLEMLQQAHGNDVMSLTRCFEWPEWFKKGGGQETRTACNKVNP